MALPDITPLIEGGVSPSERVFIDFGINPRNGLKTTCLANWIRIDEMERKIVGSYTIKQFAVMGEEENFINEFEYTSIADETMFVTYTGETVLDPATAEGPIISEWAYFTYLMTQPVIIPQLMAAYALELYGRGKFDKPKIYQQ
jgi:hypothetical protein